MPRNESGPNISLNFKLLKSNDFLLWSLLSPIPKAFLAYDKKL